MLWSNGRASIALHVDAGIGWVFWGEMEAACERRRPF